MTRFPKHKGKNVQKKLKQATSLKSFDGIISQFFLIEERPLSLKFKHVWHICFLRNSLLKKVV
jgi:hypothetical protein